MKKDSVIRIKEKIIEVTPEEEYKYLGNSDFICMGSVLNYEDLVNSKIKKNEIGYIVENRIKKRLVVRVPMKNLENRKKEMAEFFQDKFEYFVPYWKYGELTDCKEKEIGRMFGCRITLK